MKNNPVLGQAPISDATRSYQAPISDALRSYLFATNKPARQIPRENNELPSCVHVMITLEIVNVC